MKTFVVNGKVYRSLHECCSDLNISYQKLRRLCRHYQRASLDPAVAVRWCTGEEKLLATEPKTDIYRRDNKLATVRMGKFKDRVTVRVKKYFGLEGESL